MTILARRHSTTHQHVMHLHARYFTSVLNGRYTIETFDGAPTFQRTKKIAFSYAPYKDTFTGAASFIGAFNKGGNHWVFVHINNDTRKITYVDPKGGAPPLNLRLNWQVYMTVYRKEILKKDTQTTFAIKHSTSKIQGPQDNTNCGLYTLAVSLAMCPSSILHLLDTFMRTIIFDLGSLLGIMYI